MLIRASLRRWATVTGLHPGGSVAAIAATLAAATCLTACTGGPPTSPTANAGRAALVGSATTGPTAVPSITASDTPSTASVAPPAPAATSALATTRAPAGTATKPMSERSSPSSIPRPRTTPVVWHPRRGTTWQWQLSGTIQTSVVAQVYDVDLFDTPTSTVASLHRAGRRVICYLSAGSWEPGRPDSGRFPASVRGSAVPGWDERWLDIRAVRVLEPILAARMDLCRAKGFDGVEADLVDGYAATTGFPLTAADQLRYNRMLARLAHARGLSIGLKNDLDQVAQLQPVFDFAVNEQCVEFNECDRLAPFLSAGKAVFHAEYDVSTEQFCPTSRRLGLSSLRKDLELGPWRQTC
jgi:hypothetical protein